MTLHHHNGWPEFRWTVFERQLGQKDKTAQKQFHKKEEIKRTNIRVIKYCNSCLVLHLVVQDSVHQFIKISILRIEKTTPRIVQIIKVELCVACQITAFLVQLLGPKTKKQKNQRTILGNLFLLIFSLMKYHLPKCFDGTYEALVRLHRYLCL